MSYPKIIVDLKKLQKNVESVVKHCETEGIFVTGVTKVFCGYPEIAQAYIDGGVKYLGDSRMENLKKMKDLDIEKYMLRLPMISEAKDIVEYADISLNSELATIKAINNAAIEAGKTHKIIFMMDLGDLREGFFSEEEFLNTVEETLKLSNIKIVGIGTNMACYGGIVPEIEHVEKLGYFKALLKEKFDLDLEIISGGNSATIHLVEKKSTGVINNLRLGETLTIGQEPSYEKRMPNSYDDVFTVEVEIIEVKEKPSYPIGKIGKDAFGNIPTFDDKGVRKRMICAMGKQDIDFGTMFPLDDKIQIFGGSSDHIILDGTDSETDYKVGDKVKFKLEYVAVLRAMTSEYVTKEIIK